MKITLFALILWTAAASTAFAAEEGPEPEVDLRADRIRESTRPPDAVTCTPNETTERLEDHSCRVTYRCRERGDGWMEVSAACGTSQDPEVPLAR